MPSVESIKIRLKGIQYRMHKIRNEITTIQGINPYDKFDTDCEETIELTHKYFALKAEHNALYWKMQENVYRIRVFKMGKLLITQNKK